MMAPRPNRWSITIGGTLPLRKPGMFTDFAISRYALSRLGLRSSNDTSTVSLTRVGLSRSTLLGTLETPEMGSKAGSVHLDRARSEWARTTSPGNPTVGRKSVQIAEPPVTHA